MAIASTRTLPAAASSWRTALVLVALLLATVLLLYRETLVAMVGIWSRSDTFAHAFLVPPIVAWLIWRRRAELAVRTPSPEVWMLAPMAAAGVLWLLGELGGVNAAAQFALVALLVTAVLAVIGLEASRPIWFALGFAFFMVPFGEFLLPQLMSWTADFTVAALRASGVPVYRDGLQFVIPSGSWSVVEACSGVRYLIASVMVGALYAHLNYRSTRRRLAFVAVSLAVPIVANWLRAYLIVMIGHLSDNKLAAGVDHLIYGWLFFGVVMFAMFAIGARWIEAPAADGADASSIATGPRTSNAWWPVAAIALVVAALPPWAARSVDSPSDGGPVALAAPPPAAGWQTKEPTGRALTPSFKLASSTLDQTYAADGREVVLHIAYYRHQDARRKLVSSENVLLANEDRHPVWVAIAAGQRDLALNGQAFTVRTTRLRSAVNASSSIGDSARVVWQVYWVNGKLTASDARAKAYAAFDKLLGRGDDGAAIVVSVEDDRKGSADAVLERFVRDHLTAIEALLQRASASAGP